MEKVLVPHKTLLSNKKDSHFVSLFLYNFIKNYFPSAAFFASLFNLKFSQIVPPNQYGTTKVNKNINNQKPAVKINMNKTNPENWEKSNI